MGKVFRKEFMKKWKLSFWQRLKLWLFGRIIIGVDVAKDGSETVVKGKYCNGVFYIQEIEHYDER